MDSPTSIGIYNVTPGELSRSPRTDRGGLRRRPRDPLNHSDMVTLAPRRQLIEETHNSGGPTGAKFRDIFIPVPDYAQARCRYTRQRRMATIDGILATTNTPFEIKATMAEIRGIREACSRVGRPYMAI